MKNNWYTELWRIFWLLFITYIIGLNLDKLAISMIVALVAILVWYLYNLRVFVVWFEKGKKYSPPSSVGIFGDLFNQIYTMQKRQRNRYKRLVKLISRFKESTKAMPDGIVILQKNGEIEWWNDASVKLINLSYPKDVGQRITNLLRHPIFVSYYNLNEKQPYIKILSPVDEKLTISIGIIPYGNYQQLLMIRDVTSIQRIEDMQRDFIANISHELRTPITVMSGFLEEFEQNPPDDKQQLYRYIKLMQGQSSRMRQLVDDLMILSRLENVSVEQQHDKIDITSMLSLIKKDAELISADRNHDINIDIDEQLLLLGDKKSVESAFSNLIYNAINYSSNGSTIKVKWYKDDEGAHFSVVDEGIGIPEQYIARLTERFYRVDVARSRNKGGSGLGLAIVNNVLLRHDAKLEINSVVGKGSCFICHFPKDLIILKSDITPSIDMN